ncbi:MAG: tRNA (guanine(46)-N(7))-methyltransferase TrmB [Paracoccaceae bacterium]|nr:tRNA (guanine(46)-N(7))-methyltransferase TrmB [Paracoccaceae bacterium]MDE2915154.1 tRNA (guanine(46)-N(7))-methyltransferase TrmB [Paracoccaceae bacterium]
MGQCSPSPSSRPSRKLHGRRRGRPLRDRQQRHLDHCLDDFRIVGVDPAENPDRIPLAPDLGPSARPSTGTGTEKPPVWLEIGFGSGEHLLHQAVAHPQVLFFGCEPFVNGVASLLGKLIDRGVGNVRIHPGDVRDLLDVLPPGSIGRVYLLYPDPWPKRRHHRRRFVTDEYLVPLARAMTPGGTLRIATDIGSYVRQSLERVPAGGRFEWLAEGPADWRTPWRDWPSTRYEQKALRESRRPVYLTFRKR